MAPVGRRDLARVVVGANPKSRLGVMKPRIVLVPPASLVYEALAMEHGAEKYGAYNWRKDKVVASIYVDAAMRHLLAWIDGEEYAADSHVHHLAHAKASLGVLIDALELGNLVDDRPPRGPAPGLIDRIAESRREAAERKGER
jgi:hypothetical protein